jgi:hypothetical protein
MCAPIYSVGGIALAALASVVLSIAALRLAYDERAHRNILLGTTGFGLAVFCVHFIAMVGTGFVAIPDAVLPDGPLISNEALAFGVTLAAFAISGGFLLTGATFADGADGASGAVRTGAARVAAQGPAYTFVPQTPPVANPHGVDTARIPYPIKRTIAPGFSIPMISRRSGQRGTIPCSIQAPSDCSAPGPSPRQRTVWTASGSCAPITVIW